MDIPYQITIPAQSFDKVWVARINGAFPIPRKQLVTDPETGDVATVIMPQDGQLQIQIIPCQVLPSGEVVLGSAAQVKTIALSALLAQPGAKDALDLISAAMLGLAGTPQGAQQT